MTHAAFDTFFGPQPVAWLTLIGLLAAALSTELARFVVRFWDDAEVRIGVGFNAHDRRPAYAPVEQRRTSRGPPVLPPLRPQRLRFDPS